MGSSQSAIANTVLNSTTFFQLLHNKNLKLDGTPCRHLSKS
jgi:hypothetical protein